MLHLYSRRCRSKASSTAISDFVQNRQRRINLRYLLSSKSMCPTVFQPEACEESIDLVAAYNTSSTKTLGRTLPLSWGTQLTQWSLVELHYKPIFRQPLLNIRSFKDKIVPYCAARKRQVSDRRASGVAITPISAAGNQNFTEEGQQKVSTSCIPSRTVTVNALLDCVCVIFGADWLFLFAQVKVRHLLTWKRLLSDEVSFLISIVPS